MVLGLVVSAGASYLNRTYATPSVRSITGAIDSVTEGKGDRWHVMVKMADGRYTRYLISQDAATALKKATEVRMTVARGMLGFEFIAGFEPVTR